MRLFLHEFVVAPPEVPVAPEQKDRSVDSVDKLEDERVEVARVVGRSRDGVAKAVGMVGVGSLAEGDADGGQSGDLHVARQDADGDAFLPASQCGWVEGEQTKLDGKVGDEGHNVEHSCRGQPESEHGILGYIAKELIGPKDRVERRAEQASEHGETEDPNEGQATLSCAETVFEEDGAEKHKEERGEHGIENDIRDTISDELDWHILSSGCGIGGSIFDDEQDAVSPCKALVESCVGHDGSGALAPWATLAGR